MCQVKKDLFHFKSFCRSSQSEILGKSFERNPERNTNIFILNTESLCGEQTKVDARFLIKVKHDFVAHFAIQKLLKEVQFCHLLGSTICPVTVSSKIINPFTLETKNSFTCVTVLSDGLGHFVRPTGN